MNAKGRAHLVAGINATLADTLAAERNLRIAINAQRRQLRALNKKIDEYLEERAKWSRGLRAAG